MLSICIPIYNQDVTALVEALALQIEVLKVPAEIVLIDDCSTSEYKAKNAFVCQKHIYHQLKKNIGRAKIRNLFLDYVNYDYLLFLDCDALVTTSNFIENYIIVIKKNKEEIICGGRVYPNKALNRNYRLNWKYGIKTESKPAMIRQLSPNKSFMTNNFVIKKSLLNKTRFDESLTEYGHEDTLLGFELLTQGQKICHIENPILNGKLEENKVFLEKSEKAINNFPYILKKVNYNTSFIDGIKLLKTYYRLDTKGWTILIRCLFFVLEMPIRNLLKWGYINLFLFNFYKLGLLAKTLKNVSN